MLADQKLKRRPRGTREGGRSAGAGQVGLVGRGGKLLRKALVRRRVLSAVGS